MEKIILDKLKEINLKLYEIQKNQEELSKRYDLLLKEQEKENKDIYKILQQLLLKDLLSTYKNEVNSFLNISEESNISRNLKIKEPILKEKDTNTNFIKNKDYELSSLNGKKELDLYEMYEEQFE